MNMILLFFFFFGTAPAPPLFLNSSQVFYHNHKSRQSKQHSVYNNILQNLDPKWSIPSPSKTAVFLQSEPHKFVDTLLTSICEIQGFNREEFRVSNSHQFPNDIDRDLTD